MTLDDIKLYCIADRVHENTYLKYAIVYDYHVMLVAVIDLQLKLWCAYIGSVPGICHDEEQYQVRLNGTRVSQELAELFFLSIPDEIGYYEDL